MVPISTERDCFRAHNGQDMCSFTPAVGGLPAVTVREAWGGRSSVYARR